MYKVEVKLNHNEVAAKVNTETGDTKLVTFRPNNIPDGKELFEPTAFFKKEYSNSWSYLQKKLNPLEYKVAHSLGILAKANTNSLEPLSDKSTIPDLMEIFNVSKNKVKPILVKLFSLGVYGKFEIVDADKGYTKYWIFNPYLSFSGKLIPSDIADLFSNTHVAKAFRDPNYK
jgi:C1A family cysteine protease